MERARRFEQNSLSWLAGHCLVTRPATLSAFEPDSRCPLLAQHAQALIQLIVLPQWESALFPRVGGRGRHLSSRDISLVASQRSTIGFQLQAGRMCPEGQLKEMSVWQEGRWGRKGGLRGTLMARNCLGSHESHGTDLPLKSLCDKTLSRRAPTHREMLGPVWTVAYD